MAISLALVACGDDSVSGGGSELDVVATTTHAGDLVRNVGGDRVEVHTLLGPKADPHGYEPKPSDVKSIADAGLVVRSGGDLDEWLIDSVRTIKGSEHGAEETDPHWWQDPRNAILAVHAIERVLVDIDPEGRATYARNADAYVNRIRHLDDAIAACMEKVPAGKRKLVTTHDALEYFAKRYDVEIVGAIIPSLSTQAQPSARDVNQLVEQIRAEGVNAIFPETALNPKLESALGPPGSDGATYLDATASNTAAMVKGMTGGKISCRPDV